MGFWKAVLAETSNLLKHLLGEFAFQPVAFHAVQQFMAELVDHSGASPGAHRPAKLIGFARRKTRCDDGQLHALLLKQRDAQRFGEHVPNALIGIGCVLPRPGVVGGRDAPCSPESDRAE